MDVPSGWLRKTLDHLTNPVITEVWTLRPSEQRLCWMGFLLDGVGTGWHSGVPRLLSHNH